MYHNNRTESMLPILHPHPSMHCYETNTKIAQNFRISTLKLDKDRKSDNRPLRGGNLFIPQIDLPRQDKICYPQMRISPWYI